MKLTRFRIVRLSIIIICSFVVRRYDHQQMHEKHKGHDAMHAEMVIILLVTLVVAQVALVEWKKRHYRSYSVCSQQRMGPDPEPRNCIRSFHCYMCVCTISVGDSIGPVDYTDGIVRTKLLVAFRDQLDDFLLSHSVGDAPGDGKTRGRHHT